MHPRNAATHNFIRDESGSIKIFAGFLFIILVVVAGAAIDFGRSEIVSHKMHQAADAATLAGATMPSGTTEAERIAAMQRVFRLNFPDNFMGSDVTADMMNISFSPNGDEPETINVQLVSNIDTNFINLAGNPVLTSSSETEVAVSETIARDLDLIFVLDASGSMNNVTFNGSVFGEPGNISRFEALRYGAQSVVDALLSPENRSNDDLVRIGIIRWAAETEEYLPLSDDYDEITNAIQSFDDNGIGNGTNAGNSSLFTANYITNLPARIEDGETGAVTMVVYFTDGSFKNGDISQEDLGGDQNQAWDLLNSLTMEQFDAGCLEMDAMGDAVIVYTIILSDIETIRDASWKGGTRDITPDEAEVLSTSLRTCAKPDSNFTEAETEDDFATAFDEIARSSTKIRINK